MLRAQTIGRGGPAVVERGGSPAPGQVPPVDEAIGHYAELEGWRGDDRALIDHAVAALVAQNRAHAARLDAVSRFHAHRVAEVDGQRSEGPAYFALTPLQATTSEFAPVLVVGELIVQVDLDVTEALKEYFPGVWRRCLEGRLDLSRARIAYEQLLNLTNDADKRAFAELVEEYFDKVDDPEAPIFPARRPNILTAVRRRCLKFPQKDKDDSYAEAYKKRRVSLRPDDNGMATLSVVTSSPDALAADYRLTLIAKKLAQQDGEARTIEQLRVDALVDLIHGRLAVGAADSELEDDSMPDGSDPGATFTRRESIGNTARPIINVTVPITTLMGQSDEPGVMAGDVSLPADLVRQLALHPEATWYRLLTDPSGKFLELSTEGYAPTPAIWRWVVARDRTCIWPGCRRAASAIELDHRVPFPLGKTSTGNLQCLCRRHHLVKHSEGFEVVREPDGSYRWTSRFGSVFTTPAREYPMAS